MIIVLDPYLYSLIKKDVTAGWLRKEIKEDMDKLSKEHIEKRALLRKYTGKGEIKGLLDYVPEDTRVTGPDLSLNGLNDNCIIGPLNTDSEISLYNNALKRNISVYPLTHQILGNKYYRNEMFGEFAPKSVYIPDNALDKVNVNDIRKQLKDANVETLIIKDVFGYHSGYLIPYRITSIDKLDEVLPVVLKEIKRFDEGEKGLIIEEFLSGKKSTVNKCHIFGEMIKDEVLIYDIELKGLQGMLKDYKNNNDLLLSVSSRTGNSVEDIIEKLNPIIEKNLPYAFTSFDFIIKEDKPLVIDSNSIAGSLGEVQEINGNNNHNPFEFFVEKCKKICNQSIAQREYLHHLLKESDRIRNLEEIITNF